MCPTGTAVSTGETITAAKMNSKLETIDNDDLVHAVASEDAWVIGVDGTGQDITIHSDTASRALLYDASTYRLTFQDNMILAFGDAFDAALKWTGSALTLVPVANDTGSFIIGSGTLNFDIRWYAAAAKYVTFDVGDAELILEDVDLHLGDTDSLIFGDGDDVAIQWTSALLTIIPATDDTGAINIGNGTKDMDLKIFLGTTGEYAEFNVGDSMVKLVGTASTILSITSTLTGATADNAVEITLTDNQTNASGYSRGFYIAYTAAGTKSASGEANALGIDLTVTGNTPYAYIGSFYMTTSGNPTIGLASALSIYMDNMGTALSSQHILDLMTGNPTASAASTREAYIRFRNHGTGTPTCLMYAQANNNAKAATYLLEQDPVAVGPAQVGAFTNDTIGTDAEDGFINCKINGQTVKIPFWYDD